VEGTVNTSVEGSYLAERAKECKMCGSFGDMGA